MISKVVLQESYSGSELVLVAEVIKLIVSAYFVMIDTAETGNERINCAANKLNTNVMI